MNFSSKLNKGFLTLLLGILLFSMNLIAQPDQRQNRPPMPPDSTRIVQMVNEISTALSLSKDQKEKVAKLHFVHFKEVGAIMAKDKVDHETNRTKIEASRKEFEEKVESLLNNDQKKGFERFLMSHGPQRESRGSRD